MMFVGKRGPWWAVETREGNDGMCVGGRGEASGEEGAVETALWVAKVGLRPTSEASGGAGEVLQQVGGVEGEQM